LTLKSKERKNHYKDWPLKKQTTFAFGQFTTISGHFFPTAYIYISQNLGADGHFES
jgi:hypothetical protein